MPKAELLLDLQDVDTTIDRLKRRLAEIRAALHETDELIGARAALRAAEESVTQKRAQRRDLERAAAALDTRIKEADRRLYSGTVKNPKELLDLQNDIAASKKQKNTLDDQLFAAMVALEEAEAGLQACSDTLRRVDAEWRASQSELATELTQLEHELAEKTAEQTAARAKLSAPDLAQYDQLRRRKGGVAVVEMDGNVCGACGVRVTAHIQQQLSQADHLARCGNCERILVRV
jgi:predicted  nucleic acid-binding Zn-ribbon protein